MGIVSKTATAKKANMSEFTLRSVHPEYARLSDRLQELVALEAELLDQVHKPQPGTETTLDVEGISLAEQSRRQAISWVEQSPKPKAFPVQRHPGAVALLGDLLPPPVPEEVRQPEHRESWPGSAKLKELGDLIEAAREAQKLIHPHLARARAEGSAKLCEMRKPEYQALVAKIADATKALGDLLVQHHGFIDELRCQGAAWSFLRPLNLEPFGSVDDRSSVLRQVIADAIEAGHVPPEADPKWSMPTDLQRLATR